MAVAKKKSVVIVEMGLRDGLQNEKTVLDTDTRFEFAARLIAAGTRRVEIGSFVSPQWVPQMAGTPELLAKTAAAVKQGRLPKKIEFSVLVPNERGMQDAIANGVKEVAIFASCSESFSLKNINCSIEESFQRFEPVMALAKKHKIKVRGYLSTCFGCPFEGKVPEKRVIKLAARMMRLGVYELSIGDTIGVASVGQVKSLFDGLKKVVPVRKLAGHFHDTRGQALANILAAYQCGVRIFDTSFGGLGGCNYAPGATGNVATEDVVYMFHGMGVSTGLSMEKLLAITPWMEQKIQHALPSKVGQVGLLRPVGKVARG